MTVGALPQVALAAMLDERNAPNARGFNPAAPIAGTISTLGVTYGAVDTLAGVNAPSGALKIGVGSIKFAHLPELNLSTTSTNQWLVMIDVRLDQTTDYPAILAKGDRAANGWLLFADPTLNSVGFIANGQQVAWAGMPLTTMSQLALSWNGSTLAFYLNAALIGESPMATHIITDTGPVTIGMNMTVAKLVVASQANRAGIANAYKVLTSGALPPPPVTTTPAPINNGAKLIWSDEFTGAASAAFNPAEWNNIVGKANAPGGTTVAWMPGGTNNAVTDGNGNGVLTMRRESSNGYAFTSARLEHKRPWRTGYLEIRAKVPTWPGSAPGLWTFGAASSTYPSGSLYDGSNDFIEIDLLEIQTQIDPTNVRQNIHGDYSDHQYSNRWQLGWSNGRTDFTPNRPGDAFHLYGVYVNPNDNTVTHYIDHVPTYHRIPGQQPAGGIWPYGSKDMITVLEIEVGGYSGYPDNSRNSDTLTVDYVRLYDKPPF